MVKKIFMALLIVMVIVSLALAVMFLVENTNESKNDSKEANGFYTLSYQEGYNFVQNESGCTDFYKGITLKDGDKIVRARVLSQIKCTDCERNRNTTLPLDGTRVTVDLNDDNKEGVLMYNGKMLDLYDVVLVQ